MTFFNYDVICSAFSSQGCSAKHFWGYIFSRIQGYIFTVILEWSWKFVLTDVLEQVLFLFIQ